MRARTQVTLDPEMQRKARKKAAQLGISFAEYIRRLVSRDLGKSTSSADPSTVFNLGDSGGANVAVEKDRMIGEAVQEQSSGWRKGK